IGCVRLAAHPFWSGADCACAAAAIAVAIRQPERTHEMTPRCMKLRLALCGPLRDRVLRGFFARVGRHYATESTNKVSTGYRKTTRRSGHRMRSGADAGRLPRHAPNGCPMEAPALCPVRRLPAFVGSE